LLLLAPHGGRRLDPRQPGRHKVNDLHTAALTRELATAWDASSIVNGHRDRNEIDLNRVEQVRDRAPWLLQLMVEMLREMLTRTGHATVIVVHGWNVVQTACDVGMGLVERDGACRPAAEGAPTASAQFLAETIRPLPGLAAHEGIAVTIGARYPAAHPNNLLQLFASGRRRDDDPRIAALTALSGRVDAVQLELGIPLRWPGPWRGAFGRVLTQVLLGRAPLRHDDPQARRGGDRASPAGAEHARSSPVSWPVRTLGCGGRMAGRRGLEFADGDLVGMTSIDVDVGMRAVAGRLLLSPDGDRLALFTGELACRHDGELVVPTLAYRDDGLGTFRVSYDGPLLLFPLLTPFLDLESGLAGGELVQGGVTIDFAPDRDAGTPANDVFGALTGTIAIGGIERTIRTLARATTRSFGLAPSYPHLRLVLPSTPLGSLALTSTAVAARDVAVEVGGDLPGRGPLVFALAGTSSRPPRGSAVTARCTLELAASGGAVDLAVTDGDGLRARIEGRLERVIPVRRPGRAGSVIETRYALCRLAATPPGWLELSVELAAPAAASPRRRSDT
jgi:hypothetical protein